ncbi:hypothetical protein SCHPADRAFT_998491 [Schizopora paradoxa]|uniref:CAAX prenyl protease n=1 Tax=Schizopora paradoxa TaxID=27342 RepID=A0A0H2RR94_9AGAM|nr:hypothetical protein SCHPADRAFT_998491 [Schizopora paradoxa]
MDFIQSQLNFIQQKLSWVQTEPLNWKLYVLSVSWTVCLIESYLSWRQYPNYSKKEPPEALKEHFEVEKFRKSQLYGKEKAKFGIFKGLVSQFLDSAILYYGVYAYLWQTAGDIITKYGYGTEYEILQSNVYMALLVGISSLTSIPFSVYSTFVIEERHGFNKTTPKTFVLDILKGWLVAFALGAPVLSTFLWIFKWAGDSFVPWLTAFLFTFQMLMVVLYPLVIQPLFNKLSPLQEGELRTRIEALASHMNFPLKHLYEIDGSKRSSHSNAYFYGLPWSKHIVIFDTLMKGSKPEEVEAVLAHELGHWYYMHPTKMMLISQFNVFSILALFPAFLHAPPVLRSFDFPPSVAANPPTIIAFSLFNMIVTPIEAVIGIFMNMLSRKFEWEADQFACELDEKLGVAEMSDMGDRLGRALTDLHVKNLSTVWVDWMYSAYHNSHPTLTERLKAIEIYQSAKTSRKGGKAKKEL